MCKHFPGTSAVEQWGSHCQLLFYPSSRGSGKARSVKEDASRSFDAPARECRKYLCSHPLPLILSCQARLDESRTSLSMNPAGQQGAQRNRRLRDCEPPTGG